MSKRGQDPTSPPPLAFSNRTAGSLFGEVVGLSELRARPGGFRLGRLHRAAFHTVLLVAYGSGTHRVDFQDYPVGANTLVWVSPGQLQRFDESKNSRARLALIAPSALLLHELADRLAHTPPARPCLRLDNTDFAVISGCLDRLAALRHDPSGVELQRTLLTELLLRLELLADTGSQNTQLHPSFKLFQTQVERSFRQDRNVASYAARIGYSTKTVGRAVREATGLTPKQFITERVILEAKRALADGTDSLAKISTHLGFNEPTNFTSYFLAHTGQLPSQFRARVT